MRIILESHKHCRFIADFDIKRVNQQDGRLLPRIDAAPKHRIAKHRLAGYSKSLENCVFYFAFGMVERQLDFGQSQHAENMRSVRGLGNGGAKSSRGYGCLYSVTRRRRIATRRLHPSPRMPPSYFKAYCRQVSEGLDPTRLRAPRNRRRTASVSLLPSTTKVREPP